MMGTVIASEATKRIKKNAPLSRMYYCLILDSLMELLLRKTEPAETVQTTTRPGG